MEGRQRVAFGVVREETLSMTSRVCVARFAIMFGLVLAHACWAQASRPAPSRNWELLRGNIVSKPDGDFTYWVIDGYADFRIDDIRVRANRAVLVWDTDEMLAGEKALGGGGDLPRRGAIPPFSQASLRGQRLRRRMEARAESFLGKGAARSLQIPPGKERLALVLRAIYADGDVFFERGNLRPFRCRKLFVSFASDRAVMEDVEFRIPAGALKKVASPSSRQAVSFVVRSPRVVQQGSRLVARKARVTTCDAGEPHFVLESDRLTVTQLDDVTEFLGQGNRLSLAGLTNIPLPDYRYYSDQENWIPLRGMSVGVSQERGEFVLAEFGGRLNDLGQALVSMFSSRSGASQPRFRGEWSLRTGWMRKRGVPFFGKLNYELPGTFAGKLDSFFMNDSGSDRRSVTRNLDGSLIDQRRRAFVRTENRIALDDHTRLDLELFDASDPAAYSEFRPRALHETEQPETSIHLRHAKDNRRLSVIGRVDVPGFSYTDKATLAEKFRSERPFVRADLFSQPLVEVAEGLPIVLDASLGAGRLRNQFDDTAPAARREASWRADLALELSAPYTLGPWTMRPYAGIRETWYSDRPGTRSASFRKVLEFGASFATSLHRSFDVSSDALDINGLWHRVRPEIRLFHRFDVDRSPSDYFQFDPIDGLSEGSAVDFTVLNRLQTRRKNRAGESQLSDLVWLDLTQRVFPNAVRDNAGKQLGPLFFELIMTPGPGWLPLPGLRFLFEGERDWRRNDFKTRNVGVAVGPIQGSTIAAEWRSGRDGDGTGSVFANTRIFQRWFVQYGLIWDFEQDRLSTTNVMLMRTDHDWTWMLSFSRNEVTSDESVLFRFRPTLGGLLQQRQRRYLSGDPAFGVLNTSGLR